MIKNFFYSNEISQRIGELIDRYSSKKIKKIYQGDFTVLPTPEQLEACLPAIIIESAQGEHQMANEALEVMYSIYHFKIFYIYPYTFVKPEQEVREAISVMEQIGNIFLNNKNLGIEILPEANEAGGRVVNTEIKETTLSPIEDEFLSLAGVPVAIGAIDIDVHFRTFQKV